MRVQRMRRGVAFLVAGLLFLTLFSVERDARSADAAAAAPAQETFPTPEAAASAFVSAVDASDDAAYRRLFGLAIDRLASSDKIAAAQEERRLGDAAKESMTLRRDGDESVTLVLGAKRWPFPIPVVRKNGAWVFDTDAGIEELLNRRIGANELAAVALAREYVDAQRAYALEDHQDDRVLEYAQTFTSSPGRHDGLYWEAAPDEEPSPFGPFVAAAGDYAKGRKPGDPFKGYYFRILKRQGAHAPGGAYGYVINGHMIAGFALVAFPADYGSSGIMTFLVNQQGQVYEKDLGPKTATIAGGMTTYDPDSSWKAVSE